MESKQVENPIDEISSLFSDPVIQALQKADKAEQNRFKASRKDKIFKYRVDTSSQLQFQFANEKITGAKKELIKDFTTKSISTNDNRKAQLESSPAKYTEISKTKDNLPKLQKWIIDNSEKVVHELIIYAVQLGIERSNSMKRFYFWPGSNRRKPWDSKAIKRRGSDNKRSVNIT